MRGLVQRTFHKAVGVARLGKPIVRNQDAQAGALQYGFHPWQIEQQVPRLLPAPGLGQVVRQPLDEVPLLAPGVPAIATCSPVGGKELVLPLLQTVLAKLRAQEVELQVVKRDAIRPLRYQRKVGQCGRGIANLASLDTPQNLQRRFRNGNVLGEDREIEVPPPKNRIQVRQADVESGLEAWVRIGRYLARNLLDAGLA